MIHWRKSSALPFTEISDQHPPKYRIGVVGEDGKTYYGAVLSLEPGAVITVSPVPLTYAAISDRTARSKPPLPTLGPAGFTFTDPAFGSKMLRVTDNKTRPGKLDRSYRVSSSAHNSAWSADSKRFWIVSNDGSSHLFNFDPVTMQATKDNPTGDNSDIPSYVEPQFSLNDPALIFGAGGPNAHTILAIHLDANVAPSSVAGARTMIDLDKIALPTDLSGTYVGGVISGGVPHERLLTFFGGAGQDLHRYALVLDVADEAHPYVMIDTVARLGFHLHAVSIDMSGRYVSLYPSGGDRANVGGPVIQQDYLWDTATDTVTPLTPEMHPGGHDTFGFGVRVNQDCCTACAWDAAQWQFRVLSAPSATKDLIVPTLPAAHDAPKEVYLADHPSWHNAQPNALVPILSSTYRYLDDGTPWRAWDDEIIAIETANPGQPGRVWRFCHHRSDVRDDHNPRSQYFWYEPLVNVSPDGRWALFTSNWEKTLGTDAAEGTARQDVFLVELA